MIDEPMHRLAAPTNAMSNIRVPRAATTLVSFACFAGLVGLRCSTDGPNASAPSAQRDRAMEDRGRPRAPPPVSRAWRLCCNFKARSSAYGG